MVQKTKKKNDRKKNPTGKCSIRESQTSDKSHCQTR